MNNEIFLLGDIPDLADNLKWLLQEELNRRVIVFNNAEDAFVQYNYQIQYPPALHLIDYNGINGLQYARYIREVACDNVSIILQSGDLKQILRYQNEDITKYINFALDKSELKDYVVSIVRKYLIKEK